MDFVQVVLTVVQFNPDPREYQQQRTVGTIFQKVAVNVPNTPEFVAGTDEEGRAILTPAGWAYAVAEFERPFQEAGKEVMPEQDDEDFDWDDED